MGLLNPMASTAPKTALVCSGGGARGAYEAGTIRYLRQELPASVRPHVHFDVLCGTSVGAITACFMAATADAPERQAQVLEDVWSTLKLENVYKVEGEDLWSLLKKMWRLSKQDTHPDGWRLYDVLHLAPLEEIVRTRAPWPQIAANLARGKLDALSVSSTRIVDGKTVVFVQRREGGVPPWSRDPFTEARETIIGPEHALASAAIPMLFRAVRIGDEYFCDGSVRMNTPLSPALRLGADRVLILSLKHRPSSPQLPARMTTYPTTPALVGKVLNALMLDHTDYDLDRLRRFNAILDSGTAAFGAEFLPRLNETVREMRGQSYRRVKDLVIRPSRDLAEVAASYAKSRTFGGDAAASLPIRLLHRITRSQVFTQADLASYLLFDGEYAKRLMELAMEDAHQQRDAIIEFFDPASSK